jgi:hypothetical protein
MPWPRPFFLGVSCLAVASCSALLGVDFDRVTLPPDAGVDDGATSGEAGTESETGVAEGGGTCPANPFVCTGKCGDVLDACGSHPCGACPLGQTCGAGGPNACGVGTCTPNCAGKACGAFDGCSAGCDGACAGGLHCTKSGCMCDPSSCSGCCQGDILGACLPGNVNDKCGNQGAQCAACVPERPCSASGVCTKTPTLVSCEQVAPNGVCTSVCNNRGLECVSACPNPVTGTGTVAGVAYESGDCTLSGTVTGVLSCGEPFAVGTGSVNCCCQ